MVSRRCQRVPSIARRVTATAAAAGAAVGGERGILCSPAAAEARGRGARNELQEIADLRQTPPLTADSWPLGAGH